MLQASGLGSFYTFFLGTLLISFWPIIPSYVWYLGAQALFLFFFNWMQDRTKGLPWDCNICE
jgi:hypothetical protein